MRANSAAIRRAQYHNRFDPGGHSMVATADQLIHTYSIVARDPDTGQLGVAVQSHYFSVARSSRGRRLVLARSRRRRPPIPRTESSAST